VLYEINAHNVLIATQILIAYPTNEEEDCYGIILIRPRKRPRGRRRLRPRVATRQYRRRELNILLCYKFLTNIFGLNESP